VESTKLPRLIKGTSGALEHSGKCGYITGRVANKCDRAETCPADQQSISLHLSVDCIK
ncbi:unnamed protein product, partial [Hymenolepis diminuta]